MVQILETNYATQEGRTLLGKMYNDLRNAMGVVPGYTLLLGIATPLLFVEFPARTYAIFHSFDNILSIFELNVFLVHKSYQV